MEKLKNNHFIVVIGGMDSPAIQEISGLSEGESGVISRVDAGTNIENKMSTGIVKFPELTMKRDMADDVTDDEWLVWWLEAFDLKGGSISEPEGYGKGSETRRDFLIKKRNYGVDVMLFTVYDGWISQSVFDDLTSDGDSIWQQTMTINHDGLKRVRLT